MSLRPHESHIKSRETEPATPPRQRTQPTLTHRCYFTDSANWQPEYLFEVTTRQYVLLHRAYAVCSVKYGSLCFTFCVVVNWNPKHYRFEYFAH
jgi:hypothetical protein